MAPLVWWEIGLCLLLGGFIGGGLTFRRNRRYAIGLGMAIIMRGYIRAAEATGEVEAHQILTAALDKIVHDDVEFSKLFDFASRAVWKMYG